MSLPKIDLPLFELTVPSNGKKVKYRPYNVREEKILLVAQESDDLDQTILAIKQIITNTNKTEHTMTATISDWCFFSVDIIYFFLLSRELILHSLSAITVLIEEARILAVIFLIIFLTRHQILQE